MGSIAEGVTSLLEGREPTPPPSRLPIYLVYAAMFGIIAFQGRRITVWVAALRQRRLPRGRLPWARLRIGGLLALSLGWSVIVLVLVPKQLGLPLLTVAQGMPDAAYILLGSGILALSWGIVRTAWAYSTLRRACRRHMPEAAIRPATSQS
jgi:hypothetical protein